MEFKKIRNDTIKIPVKQNNIDINLIKQLIVD